MELTAHSNVVITSKIIPPTPLKARTIQSLFSFVCFWTIRRVYTVSWRAVLTHILCKCAIPAALLFPAARPLLCILHLFFFTMNAAIMAFPSSFIYRSPAFPAKLLSSPDNHYRSIIPRKPVRPTRCKSHSPRSFPSPAVELDEKSREAGGRMDEEGRAASKGRPPLAEVWREIQGCNNWEGLLDPFDENLRKEIIRYGEFAQACYDAFDFDPFSKYCGSCKYPLRGFFQGLEMSNYGYQITRYLYATSNINLPKFFRRPRHVENLWSSHANWMGFIAVAQDPEEIRRLGRRDIVVAWRGTVTYLEWIADLTDYLKPIQVQSENGENPHSRIKVESGFLNLYTAKEHRECRFCGTSARDEVLSEVGRLVERYRGEELSLTVTGHSLGSALAMLSAYDLAETGLNRPRGCDGPPIPITVFSFAGPRVGNRAFRDRCEEIGVKVLRVVNVHDGVPKVPGILLNERLGVLDWLRYGDLMDRIPWCYSHVGVELALDHRQSPFLKDTKDPACAHNLEAYLHLVDGYHGRGRRFHLVSKRDHALVNKACDFLKDHYLVPPSWRQDANRGLVKNSEGRWVQPEVEHHLHSHLELNPSPDAQGIVSVNGHQISYVHL